MHASDYEIELSVDTAPELLCLADETEELTRCTHLRLWIDRMDPADDTALAKFLDVNRFPRLVELTIAVELLPHHAWSSILTLHLRALRLYHVDLFDRHARELAASSACQALRELYWWGGVLSIDGFRTLARAVQGTVERFEFDAGATDTMIDELLTHPWPALRQLTMWSTRQSKGLSSRGVICLRRWATDRGLDDPGTNTRQALRPAARPRPVVLTAVRARTELGDRGSPELRQLVERLLLDYDMERTRDEVVPWLDEQLPELTIDAGAGLWPNEHERCHPARRFTDAPDVMSSHSRAMWCAPHPDGPYRATSLSLDLDLEDWPAMNDWPLAERYPRLQRLVLPARNCPLNRFTWPVVCSWSLPRTLRSIELGGQGLGYRAYVDGHRFGYHTFTWVLEDVSMLVERVRAHKLRHVVIGVTIGDHQVRRSSFERYMEFQESRETLDGVPVHFSID